jgi:hypothetical protein
MDANFFAIVSIAHGSISLPGPKALAAYKVS